jgi:hypothetical protein
MRKHNRYRPEREGHCGASDVGTMEIIEIVQIRAIQPVAHDPTAQPGQVHPQLMRAAGHGLEFHESSFAAGSVKPESVFTGGPVLALDRLTDRCHILEKKCES